MRQGQQGRQLRTSFSPQPLLNLQAVRKKTEIVAAVICRIICFFNCIVRPIKRIMQMIRHGSAIRIHQLYDYGVFFVVATIIPAYNGNKDTKIRTTE
jgi:hypothetical protein